MLDWVLHVGFAYAVVNLNVAAIQIFMWIYMLSFYLEAQPDIRRRRLPYILASLAILVLSSAAAIMQGVYTYSVLLEASPGSDNVEAAEAIEEMYWAKLLAPAGLLSDVAIRVADAVLVYRCYVVWFDRPWVTAFPVCIFLTGLGVSLRTYIPLDFNDERWDTADVSLILVLNVLVTLLISYRLIQAQRKFSKIFPEADHKIYFGIVAILVESAAPLAALSIGYTITLMVPGEAAYRANDIFGIPFNAALILAPQLVIFRVATGVTWSNKTETSALFSHPIEFTDRIQRCDEESTCSS